MGYKHSENDYSLFSKKISSSTIFVAVYVDDVIITGTDSVEISNLKAFLDKHLSSPLDPTLKLKSNEGTLLQDPTYAQTSRYLKKDLTLGIFFSNGTDCSISAYCDSDWAACPDSRRSVTGYIVLVGDSHIN
ncbi:uncharacterized protein LOC142167958 [Nicotiana tabacum]|uniref:Uncharacterized protein LOC142167958 n=1 Tax=Nicotiana tabacum TaxID=4097 RepID=A0AC58SIB3_TOBAC